MKLTPRNNLCTSLYSHTKEFTNEIDFLYEVADAELASDYSTYLLWENLSKQHKEFRKTFARSIQHKIKEIAIENNVKFWCQHWIDVVAERISHDWWNAYSQPERI